MQTLRVAGAGQARLSAERDLLRSARKILISYIRPSPKRLTYAASPFSNSVGSRSMGGGALTTNYANPELRMNLAPEIHTMAAAVWRQPENLQKSREISKRNARR